MAGVQDIYEPMKYSETEDNGLYNPEGPALMLMLWLYSIEPPFYSDLNKAMRYLDQKQLKHLGPWAKALHIITVEAEKNRKDSYTAGEDITRVKPDHPIGNQCCMFLLFKGIPMKDDWIKEWQEAISSEK